MLAIPKTVFVPALRHVRSCLLICCLALGFQSVAQKTDTSTVAIHIVNMEMITSVKTDSGEFDRLQGNVILQQGTDTLYCDSALMSKTSRNFEAFSNVRIAQAGGTHGTSDYLKYTSAVKRAFMSGNVRMADGKNNLECSELTYDLGPKIAIYDKGGRLYNDSTTVTSNRGEYNIGAHEARFKGNVHIVDTQYRIKSEDVQYNTESKVTVFYAHSVVTRDSGRSILETSDGWYDGKLGIAHFKGFSKIWNEGQYIEGDSLYYNKLTGLGIAVGHVVSIDTAHHSTMYCGRAVYYQKQRRLWATIKPVLQQVNGKDTFYIRADTFYSAPMVKNRKPAVADKKPDTLAQGAHSDTAAHPVLVLKDSVVRVPVSKADSDMRKMDSVASHDLPLPAISGKYRVPRSREDTGDVQAGREVAKQHTPAKKGKKHKSSEPVMTVATTDTAIADTTAPLYFIGYHHVLLFSDSLQGKCDSICYTRADSLIRMMYSPVAWSRKSQITGDTILMQLDSITLRKLYVPNNALVVSQSGPAMAHLWDQVQGKTLTAYFDSSTIKQMVVKPDAECIYYSKDDKGAYVGVIQSSGNRMFVFFDDQKIKNIRFDRDAHISLTPMLQADLPNMKLGKFKWLEEQRPRDKEELFR